MKTITEEHTMRFEFAESNKFPGEWVVEAIDSDSEGEIYFALFSGPDAKQRAEEYAAWKNDGNGFQGFRH